MAKKCKETEHNWTGWEPRWDPKNSTIWTRFCVNCGTVEKSIYTPPPAKSDQKVVQKPDVIQWLDLQMASK